MNNIKDTIFGYISHLRNLVINLNGYDPHRTAEDVEGIYHCGLQTAVILMDLIEAARNDNIITDDEMASHRKTVFELNNQLRRIHNGLITEG